MKDISEFQKEERQKQGGQSLQSSREDDISPSRSSPRISYHGQDDDGLNDLGLPKTKLKSTQSQDSLRKALKDSPDKMKELNIESNSPKNFSFRKQS